MIRLMLGATLFAIAACATPGTEPDRSGSTQATGLQATESGADELVVNNDQAKYSETATTESIEALEAPNAPETAPQQMPHQRLSESGVVCDKVVETGSILPSDVCRRQADIQRRQAQDQRLYEQIKRNTAIFTSRM